jgi:hypothetical protein
MMSSADLQLLVTEKIWRTQNLPRQTLRRQCNSGSLLEVEERQWKSVGEKFCRSALGELLVDWPLSTRSFIQTITA